MKYNRFIGDVWMWMIFLEWVYDCFIHYYIH
jgi:hypothetical protein